MSDLLARISALAVFATAAIALLALFFTSGTGLRGTEVSAEFEDAFPLLPGMNVRVSGAVAGTVKSVELTDQGTAMVSMVLFEGTEPPTTEASASVRQQDITGDSFVALELGDAGEPLGDVAISTKRTLVAPRFDDLLNTFDSPTRAGLKLILVELGTAFERRGDDFNEAMLSLRPALEATNQALNEIESQNTALKALVESTENITSQTASRSDELGSLVDSLALTLNTTAAHSEGLDRGLERAPETVSAARTTLGHLTRLSLASRPLVHTLAEGAGDFGQTLELLGPFLHDSSTALADLEPTLEFTEQALVAAEPTLEVGGKRLATAPFDLAGGIADLFRVILGGKDVLRALFGGDSYGHGPSLANDVGFGATAVEAGNPYGYEDQDPNRNFLRSVGVLSCESFGLAIAPGCLTDALQATSAATASAHQSGSRRAPGPPEAQPSETEPDPQPQPEDDGEEPRHGGEDDGPLGPGSPELPRIPGLPDLNELDELLPGLLGRPGNGSPSGGDPLNGLLDFLFGP